jgi:2-dehydropantoate 2-reductase
VAPIGGFAVAARLAQAGHDVSVLARGAHLAAMRERGRIVIEAHGGGAEEAPVTAVADAREAAPPELLFIAAKAHQVPALAPQLAAAAAAASAIVPCHNGVGWWDFQRRWALMARSCAPSIPGRSRAISIRPR